MLSELTLHQNSDAPRSWQHVPVLILLGSYNDPKCSYKEIPIEQHTIYWARITTEHTQSCHGYN